LFFFLAVAFAHEGHSHDHADSAGTEHEHVVSLTTSNFASTIAAHELTMVEFFAPWCGHCKKLAPEYEKAATELLNEKDIAVAKVDCDDEKTLCGQHEVQGFPTLKLFRKDGTSTDYDKGRTGPDIVKYLRKQSQPAFSVVTSADDLQAKKLADSVVLVAFVDQTSATADVLKKTANALRNDAAFVIASSSLGGSHANKVVLFRNYDEPEVVFTGAVNTEDLTKFIQAESFPLLGEIGPENYQKYVERALPLVWFFLDLESDTTKDVEAAAREAAVTAKGKLSFVKLDGKRWASHAKNLALSGNLPGIVIEVREGNKKFVFPEGTPVTKESLGAFVNNYLTGTLQPNTKSQEIPVQDGPVVVIVGKTYDSIVNDATKDVLVEFYAPWCGHCKNLAPKYDALGEEFKGTNVVIAKVDATENDTPRDDVRGFPTIIFFPANDKKGMTYNGERTQEAISGWIKEHATTLKNKKPHDEL